MRDFLMLTISVMIKFTIEFLLAFIFPNNERGVIFLKVLEFVLMLLLNG